MAEHERLKSLDLQKTEFQETQVKLGVVAQSCNPNTQETEAEGSLQV